MKDIHTHILFGIDDGSESLKESISIIKQAINAGYTDLVLTPHYRREQDFITDNKEKEKVFKKLKREVQKQKLNINLYLGNEVTLDDMFFTYIKKEQYLSVNKSNYYLIELPLTKEISNLEETLDKMLEIGIKPIIVHPERYYYLKPKDLIKYVEKGVLLQGNIGSLFNKYGKDAKQKIEEYLKRNMIHMMGSDIHHDNQTTYQKLEMTKELITKLTNNQYMYLDLLDKNINKVINNEQIETYKIKKKFFKFYI